MFTKKIEHEIGWFVHNLVAHPILGVCGAIAAITNNTWYSDLGAAIHDTLMPTE